MASLWQCIHKSIALEVRLSLQIALLSLINCIIQECRRRMSLCVGTFCTRGPGCFMPLGAFYYILQIDC